MASPALELQAAIVAALKSDPAIGALVNGVYDRVPENPWGAANGYISLGPEDTISDEAGCVALDNVSVQIDVWSRRVGRVHCKQVLHEVRRIIRGLATEENPIVSRSDPFQQIARDPDGLTTHGFLRYEFEMEAHG